MQTNKMIVAALDEYVSGHLEAKKALAVMMNRSRIRLYQRFVEEKSHEDLIAPLKILLVGASGTGKTHLVDTLKRIACIPVLKLDATNLTPSGAGGGIKAEKLPSMIIHEAEKYHDIYPEKYPTLGHAIEHTIVYVDEIDKLGTQFESSGNWNRHVQSNFLTIFDNKDDFAGVSFIFSGAFVGITKPEEKVITKTLGFTPSVDNTPVTKAILDEQLLDCGIIPELLGRINMVIKLDTFSKSEFVKIMKERIIPKKQKDLESLGIYNIDLSEEEINTIAENAVKSGQGVRYLQREAEKVFIQHEFEAEYTLEEHVWEDLSL